MLDKCLSIHHENSAFNHALTRVGMLLTPAENNNTEAIFKKSVYLRSSLHQRRVQQENYFSAIRPLHFMDQSALRRLLDEGFWERLCR